MHNLHPGMILILTGLLCFVLPERVRSVTAAAGSAAALAAVLLLGDDPSLTYEVTQGLTLQLLHADRLSFLFGLIFCVIAVIAAIYSRGEESRWEKGASLIYAGSSLGVIFAGDWISLICFWEAMAVSSWIVVWSGKTRSAVRASYRYLVMHLAGGNLLLAGGALLCIHRGIQLELLTGSGGAAFWLILAGVCINAGVPPLHTWIPDAYPESTVSGTVFLGSYTTKTAVYILIRLFAGTEELVMLGAVMAVFGACMALIENDLRRLLSYHIVSQIGMMVAALGTGSAVGMDGAALHSAFNILYKGVLLMAAGAVIRATGKRKITELGGLGKKMPVTAICFLIASLSIAGVPFLNGFVSKALIMESLHHYQAAYWLVMLAGVGTWLSITMKINYFVFWGKKYAGNSTVCEGVPLSMNVAMAAAALLCVATGIFADFSYGFTPNGTIGHPFTSAHILEYVGLFVGATVPFVLFLPKMAPHDRITLDFDWFYRRWLAEGLTKLSLSVNGLFGFFEQHWNRFTYMTGQIIKQPARLFERGTVLPVAESDDEAEGDTGAFEGDMPVGAFMQVFVIFCVVAFLLIMALERLE